MAIIEGYEHLYEGLYPDTDTCYSVVDTLVSFEPLPKYPKGIESNALFNKLQRELTHGYGVVGLLHDPNVSSNNKAYMLQFFKKNGRLIKEEVDLVRTLLLKGTPYVQIKSGFPSHYQWGYWDGVFYDEGLIDDCKDCTYNDVKSTYSDSKGAAQTELDSVLDKCIVSNMVYSGMHFGYTYVEPCTQPTHESYNPNKPIYTLVLSQDTYELLRSKSIIDLVGGA